MPPKRGKIVSTKSNQPSIKAILKNQKKSQKSDDDDSDDVVGGGGKKLHPMFTKDGMATQQRVEAQTKRKKPTKKASSSAKRKMISLSESDSEVSPVPSPQPVKLELNNKAKPLRQGIEVTTDNCSSMFKVNYRTLVVEDQRKRERQKNDFEDDAQSPKAVGSDLEALLLVNSYRRQFEKKQKKPSVPSPDITPSIDIDQITFGQQRRVEIRNITDTDSEDDAIVSQLERKIFSKKSTDSSENPLLPLNASARGQLPTQQTQRNTQIEYLRYSQPDRDDSREMEAILKLKKSSRSHRISVVRDHIKSTKTTQQLEKIIESANIGAAGGLGTTFKSGSNGRMAATELLKRTYANCLLRRLGVYYEGSEGSNPCSGNQNIPWTAFYSPTTTSESVSPCQVVATQPPVTDVRQWLQGWRSKLFPGEGIRFRSAVSTLSQALVVLSAVVCYKTVDVIFNASLTIQKVGRRYLKFKPKTKRRGRPGAGFTEAARKRQDKLIQDSYRDNISESDCGDEEEESDYDADLFEGGLVVCGSAGIGKTSAIYAAAAELGFQVLEISANRKRTKETLFREVRDATTSRYVGASKPKQQKRQVRSPSPLRSPTRSPPRSPSSKRATPQLKRRKGKTASSTPNKDSARLKQKRQLDISSFFSVSQRVKREQKDDEPEQSEVVADEDIEPPQPQQRPLLERNGKDSQLSDEKESKEGVLILFEGADVVFPDEGSFISGIKTLVAEAKCPIVLTCKSLTPSIRDLRCREIWFDNDCTDPPALNNIGTVPPISTTQWPGTIPNRDAFGTHSVGLGTSLILQTILLAEGFLISPKMAESLILTYATDIRAAINTCQLWLQGTANPAILSLATGQEYIPVNATEAAMAAASLGALPLGCSSLGQYLLGFGTKSGNSFLHGSTSLTNTGESFGTEMIFHNYLRLIKKATDCYPSVVYRPPPVAVDVDSPMKKTKQKETHKCRLSKLLDEVSTDSSETNIMATPEQSTQESVILFPDTVQLNDSILTEDSRTPRVSIRYHLSFTDAWLEAIRHTKPLPSNKTFFNKQLLSRCAGISKQASLNDVWKSSKRKAGFELLHNEGIDDLSEEGAWWREDELQLDWLTNTATALTLRNLVNLEDVCLSKSEIFDSLSTPILGPEKKSYCESSISNCVIISHPGSHIGDLIPCVMRPLHNLLFGNSMSSRKKVLPHRIIAVERLIERRDYIEMLHFIYTTARKNRKQNLKTMSRLNDILEPDEWEQVLHYVRYIGMDEKSRVAPVDACVPTAIFH